MEPPATPVEERLARRGPLNDSPALRRARADVSADRRAMERELKRLQEEKRDQKLKKKEIERRRAEILDFIQSSYWWLDLRIQGGNDNEQKLWIKAISGSA